MVEFTPTNYDSAKATCVSTCSDWNYHGRRCSLFYVGSGTTDNSWKDKCFIANVDYEDVDIVEKGTPDSMEFRWASVRTASALEKRSGLLDHEQVHHFLTGVLQGLKVGYIGTAKHSCDHQHCR